MLLIGVNIRTKNCEMQINCEFFLKIKIKLVVKFLNNPIKQVGLLSFS